MIASPMTRPPAPDDHFRVSRGAFARNALAIAAALAGEAPVVLLAANAAVTPGLVVAAHLAVAGVVAAILFYGRPEDQDASVATLIFLLVLVSGPAGAAAALAMLAFTNRPPAGSATLAAWYRRLADAGAVETATAMHDRVAAGRVLRFDAAPPARFLEVIATGSLEERQTALGLMARKFDPRYAPALEAALRSPEPVVRVQAAAVAARVRGDLKGRVATLLATPAPGGPRAKRAERFAKATALRQFWSCPFVDDGDKARCRVAFHELLNGLAISAEDVSRISAAAEGDTLNTLESYLLDTGRIREFRVSRRMRDIIGDSSYRVRRPKSAGVR